MKRFLTIFLLLFFITEPIFALNTYDYDEEIEIGQYPSNYPTTQQYIVKQNKKYGVYTKEGKEIVPIIYDRYLAATKDSESFYYFFVKNFDTYVVDEKNKETKIADHPYDKTEIFNQNSRLIEFTFDGVFECYDPKTNTKSETCDTSTIETDENFSRFLFSIKDSDKKEYYFYQKGNVVSILDNEQKLINTLDIKDSKIRSFGEYILIEQPNGKKAYYNPKTNKQSKFYDDIRYGTTRASMVFYRELEYLQYKKLGIYQNFDKKITPRKIALLPVEIPIALFHDLGELMLIGGTCGLYYIFMGSDWWLTGKGAQGIP